MDKLTLSQHLKGVLQIIPVIDAMYYVEQIVERVSQMDHGLDQHLSVYVSFDPMDQLHRSYRTLIRIN